MKTDLKNEASSQPTTAIRWKADQDALAMAATDAGPKVAIKRPKAPRKSKNEASSQPTTAIRWKADQAILAKAMLLPEPTVVKPRSKGPPSK